MPKTPEIIYPVSESIQPDGIVCLFDGVKRKLLHRHVKSVYDMTWDQYKAYCQLPDDYPAVAPLYAAEKRHYANIGRDFPIETYGTVSVPLEVLNLAAASAEEEGVTLQFLVERVIVDYLTLKNPPNV